MQSVQVIHCDLKPENILLRHPKRSAIKLIDFGSSCRYSQRMYKYIQSRFYRSPEVLLELDYGPPIDVWSLACILVELHTGEPLFCGLNEADQLSKIIEVLGPPPDYMIRASPKARKFFTMQPMRNENTEVVVYKLRDPPSPPQQQQQQQPPQPQPQAEPFVVAGQPGAVFDGSLRVRRPLSTVLAAAQVRRRDGGGDSAAAYLRFRDLLERLLQYDPRQRLTPHAALQHPFFHADADVSLPLPLPPAPT